MMVKNTKVVEYIRVSTDEQARKGVSLEAQEEWKEGGLKCCIHM